MSRRFVLPWLLFSLLAGNRVLSGRSRDLVPESRLARRHFGVGTLSLIPPSGFRSVSFTATDQLPPLFDRQNIAFYRNDALRNGTFHAPSLSIVLMPDPPDTDPCSSARKRISERQLLGQTTSWALCFTRSGQSHAKPAELREFAVRCGQFAEKEFSSCLGVFLVATSHSDLRILRTSAATIRWTRP